MTKEWLTVMANKISREFAYRKMCRIDFESLPAYSHHIDTRLRIYPHGEDVQHWTKWDYYFSNEFVFLASGWMQIC